MEGTTGLMKFDELINLVNKIPKVELHVHIEGSISAKTILALAKKNKLAIGYCTVEEIKRWFKFENFAKFSQIYRQVSNCIQTVEDIELVARDFLVDRYSQNILYTEAIYTPYTHYIQKGIPFNEQIDAVCRARSWAFEHFGIDSRIIIDISRQESAESGITVANWAVSAMDKGVVALGLGGPECGNPPEKFESAFAIAKEAGLASLPHAGETEGPNSIWGALNTLNARRIGHGVRCIEDENLISELIKRKIALEVCPSSNICLGVFKAMADHPIRELFDRGVIVTVNSDDPELFSTSLSNEIYKLITIHSFTAAEIKSLMKTAINESLLSGDQKKSLLNKFKLKESCFGNINE